ncbi:29627_t:CDS:2, partial [Gigaspora margarita]
MSSLFTAFCFTKNVTNNNKHISGIALYQINYNVNKFREITFKGFIANSKSLIIPFKKNSIVLMIGCYVYEDIKYVMLVQAVPISSSEGNYILAPEDLPNSLPLLTYTTTIVSDSYIANNQDRQESFILARWLYNRVTNNKNMDSRSPASNTKVNSEVELDVNLDSIKEKYATMTLQIPQKRLKINQYELLNNNHS